MGETQSDESTPVAGSAGGEEGIAYNYPISALVKLAQSEGKKTTRGVEFQLPASHQELANQLGKVRELISRNLMRLQAEGLLDVDARQIVVKDLKGLSALLETPA